MLHLLCLPACRPSLQVIPSAESEEEEQEYKAFDALYEVSRHGIIRNRLTKQPVQRSGPKEDDPHVYVQLVLAETGKQKRLAVKHVVAHVWSVYGKWVTLAH
jgi:uncharacterized protein YbaR (Trm112 family)